MCEQLNFLRYNLGSVTALRRPSRLELLSIVVYQSVFGSHDVRSDSVSMFESPRGTQNEKIDCDYSYVHPPAVLLPVCHPKIESGMR